MRTRSNRRGHGRAAGPRCDRLVDHRQQTRHTSAQAPRGPIVRSCTGMTRCAGPAFRCAGQVAVHGHAAGAEVRGRANRAAKRPCTSRADGAEPRYAHGTGRARRTRAIASRRAVASKRTSAACAKSPCARRLGRGAERARRRRPGEAGTRRWPRSAARRSTPRSTSSCWRSNRANRRCSMLRATSFARWDSNAKTSPASNAIDTRRGASPFARRCTAT